MRIYKENIQPNKMMNCSTPYCRQVREGLLCWTYNTDGELFPSHPSRIWFVGGKFAEPQALRLDTKWKEPAIISGIEEWLSVWGPLHDLGEFFEPNMISRLRELDNDIDKLYWDDFLDKKGYLTYLLSLLPRPIEENLLLDIVEDMAQKYNLNLDKNYWFNQRHTIHFWTHDSGLLTFISSLQYDIGLNKIRETNAIIRKWIPTLKPYMDNSQFWEDFFKGEE